MRPVLVCFWGAGPLFVSEYGGSWTSGGVTEMAKMAADMGYRAECFTFGPNGLDKARAFFEPFYNAGAPLSVLGYSLGNTAATYLQLYNRTKRCLCIAESELAGKNNHQINHSLCERSVLWRNPQSTLSGAGAWQGFDQIINVPHVPHLAMDYWKSVQDGVRKELLEALK